MFPRSWPGTGADGSLHRWHAIIALDELARLLHTRYEEGSNGETSVEST